MRADEVAALAEGMNMAPDGADRLELGARQTEQMVVHPLEMLANDIEAGFGHQMVDVGDPTGDRVLDRHHRQRRPALPHRRERVLESIAGQRRHRRKHLPAGEVGIGAGLPLEGDRPCRCRVGHANQTES